MNSTKMNRPEHAFRWLHSADEAPDDRGIACFTSGERNDDEAHEISSEHRHRKCSINGGPENAENSIKKSLNLDENDM